MATIACKTLLLPSMLIASIAVAHMVSADGADGALSFSGWLVSLSGSS